MKTEITKEEFKKYVKVQMRGVVNMFDVKSVEALSGLPRGKVSSIMENYEELAEKYPDVV